MKSLRYCGFKNKDICYVVIATILLFIALSFVCIKSYAQEAAKEQQQILLKTNVPIEMGKTKDGNARFGELTQTAIQLGLDRAILVGEIKHTQAESGDKRAYIKWHSVQLQNSPKGQITQPLKSPLSSQFRTGEERVEANTDIWAVGDLDALKAALENLKIQESAPVDVKQVRDKEKEARNAANQQRAVSDGVDGVQTGMKDAIPQVQYKEASTPTKATDEVYSREEICAQRLCDYEKAQCYSQYKTITYQNNKMIKEGACVPNFSEAVPLEYDACNDVINFNENEAYQALQYYYIEPEKNDSKQEVGTCTTTNSTYPLFQTTQTCTALQRGSYIIPYGRTAYYKEGKIAYASECAPLTETPVEIVKEQCEPAYENDYEIGVSFLMVKQYYINPETQAKVYLTGCQRDTENTYFHKKQLCEWKNFDAELKSEKYEKTYISASNGTMWIKDCELTATVDYINYGEKTKNVLFQQSETYTMPNTVTSIDLRLVGGGKAGGPCWGKARNFDTGSQRGWRKVYYDQKDEAGQNGENLTKVNLNVKPGDPYQITVGKGGTKIWENGQDSSITGYFDGSNLTFTAKGGTLKTGAYTASNGYDLAGVGNIGKGGDTNICQSDFIEIGNYSDYSPYYIFYADQEETKGKNGAVLISYKQQLFLRGDGTEYAVE